MEHKSKNAVSVVLGGFSKLVGCYLGGSILSVRSLSGQLSEGQSVPLVDGKCENSPQSFGGTNIPAIQEPLDLASFTLHRKCSLVRPFVYVFAYIFYGLD